MVGMTVGPTVTRYELELGPGVKVARVTTLHKDIAYAMATADVRILAPIPGKSAIGVECRTASVSSWRPRMCSSPRGDVEPGARSRGRRKDIDGKPVMVDIAKMPHVLVAGTTGSGKSSCINSLLTSILMRSTPDDVRLILIDPKMVELSPVQRAAAPAHAGRHEPEEGGERARVGVEEMERRYELLARLGFRDLGGYNAAIERGELEDPYADDPAGGIGLPPAPQYAKLASIVVVVDELADLMMVAAREVEESICRIAQKARSGRHPSRDRHPAPVGAGDHRVIKANVPSRFAFAVSSLVDSRVILDQPGAERLIGQGDMLMLTVSSNIPVRVQGKLRGRGRDPQGRPVLAHAEPRRAGAEDGLRWGRAAVGPRGGRAGQGAREPVGGLLADRRGRPGQR